MTTKSDPSIPADLVRSIERLEPLPLTAQRLVAMMNGGDVSLAEVAELIEFDQAVVATVLRTARSAAFCGLEPPESVREAVIRLGTARLLDLVLGDHLARLRVAAPLYDLSEDDLWAHAAAAQLAISALREECPALRLPEAAETAALLHDIGKLVMTRYLKANVTDIVTYAASRGTTFVDAERALFGTDHAKVGAAIATHWHFPELIADAIGRHHDVPLGASTPVLDAVVVANLAAKTVGVGLGAEGFNFGVDGPCAARLELDFRSFARVCLRADTWLRELRAERASPSRARPTPTAGTLAPGSRPSQPSSFPA